MNRRVFPVAACLAVLLTCAATAAHATTIKMTLSGIGTDISIDSFSYSLTGSYVPSGSGWRVQSPTASDFSIMRTVDSFSTKLQLAAVESKLIPSADIEFFKSSSPTVPYLDLHFTNGLVTSYKVGGGGPTPGEEETFSFTFEQVTLTYAADSSNPWGAVLPLASQVQEGPFALNFAYDQTFDVGTFGDSTILMDATIPGQLQPVPEPASIVLLGSGLMCIAGWCAGGARRIR